MKKIILIYLLFTSTLFSQSKENLFLDNKNIVLLGEAHFVKEKYDEIKSIIFESLNNVSSGAHVKLFLELPVSLNYAIHKIEKEDDKSLFLNWFKNIYNQKDKSPSYFWTDNRDFILDLYAYAEKKDIILEIKCIDLELIFRRTAYILSNLDNKRNTEIDRFLALDYIEENTENRKFLIDYIDSLLITLTDIRKKELLNQIKIALSINCTICINRDNFMRKNFIKYYDPDDVVSFVNLGLDHILNSHNFLGVSEVFKSRHKIDTLGYKSFYNLIKNKFKSKIFKIGIIAFNQEMRFSDMMKSENLTHFIEKEEHNYINTLFKDETVVRLNLSEHLELERLSSHLDYIIVYKSSAFRY